VTRGRREGGDRGKREGEAYDGGSLRRLDRETVGLDCDAGTGCISLLVLALDLVEALVSISLIHTRPPLCGAVWCGGG
jgi:hypothetical protein